MYGKLGAAVDIGTTTVALYLIDIQTGRRLGTAGRMNAQAAYGADVTSRIQYCAANGHEKLTLLIREQIDEMAKTALREATPALSGDDTEAGIEQIAIAGNTIMQHLAAGYSPAAMGRAPFTPESLFGLPLPAWDSFPAAPGIEIYYAPCISAYVGGDITAGLFAAGFEEIDKPALFIDIGTNGEIALKHQGIYYCCAAAAGPAFEGAEISKGMAAVNGAVDHVWRGKDGGVEYSVIGNAEPQGLCGSGLLDLLAVLLDKGAVDSTGRLANSPFYLPGCGEKIYITAADIRKLQLAKAAIAGGIRVLLRYAGVEAADIKHLALAGGFGSFLKPESAARIGLFPGTLLPVTKAYGNTAGEGAVMMLRSGEAQERLRHISRCCEYIELSSNAYFNDVFVEEMPIKKEL